MTTQSWRGTWWVPSAPEARVPGTLHLEDDERLRLELVGGLANRMEPDQQGQNGSPLVLSQAEKEIIHGWADNKKFTLLDNLHSGTKFSDFIGENISHQDWSPARALQGVHLQNREDPVFVRGHLRTENLLQWTEMTAFTGGKTDGSPSYSTQKLEPLEGRYGDTKITLQIRATGFYQKDHPDENIRKLTSTEYAILTLTPPSPVPYHGFDRIQKDMQDLLTLLTYTPCGVINRSIIHQAQDGEGITEVRVYGRQIYRTKETKKPRNSHDFLMPLSSMKFDELIEQWGRVKNKSRTACNILFGLRYIPEGYVGTRLLGVATAAESLHATLREHKTPLEKSTYRALKRKILEALHDESAEIRDFVNHGLRNNPTYYERLLDLHSMPDPIAATELIADPTSWARMLKNSRNDLAHANERSGRDQKATAAFWLLEITYAFLSLVLLSELGASAEVQQRAVRDNARMRFASEQFEEFTRAESS
ncbi:ApeA N-terminal domain 1-containing protein [Streptomyces sp. NPDC002248]